VSDYGLLEKLGEATLQRASKSEGLPKLALAQEGNRLLFEAHRIRNRMRIPYPDNDPALESIRGLVRSKKPRYDLAEQRLAEVLKQDPANTELLLMRAELKIAQGAQPDAIGEAFVAAQTTAATPESFHTEATWHQQKSSGRGRAAAALERGVAAFPNSGRLKRRLAGIYVDQNRLDDAVRVLREAMEIEPMMPDTYGLLGEIHLRRGPAHFDEAEAALAEARRLDPENALHMARLGALVMERGVEGDEERTKLANELLTAAIEADGKNFLAHAYLGRLLVLTNGDLERAEWLLKKAQKLDERAATPMVERARLAVRKADWAEATHLLDKAIKLEPARHDAFFARGELAEAQGNPFVALAEFQRALERSPRESGARAKYEAAIARMRALIESGAYAELQKAAEAAAAAEAEAGPAVRREPGKTTQRRRRRGKGGAAGEGGAGEGAEGAGAEGGAAEGAGAEGTSEGAEGAAAEGAGPEEGLPVSGVEGVPPEMTPEEAEVLAESTDTDEPGDVAIEG
jgi:tetratricopeptide (TPR) repeat protein